MKRFRASTIDANNNIFNIKYFGITASEKLLFNMKIRCCMLLGYAAITIG